MPKNFNTNEAFESLKEFLLQSGVKVKIVSGGREIVKRCHICGDSHDLSSAHMYIGVRSDGKICYNCFKCNAGGYVDGKFLRDIGCYEPHIMKLCQDQNQLNSDSNSIQNGASGRRKYNRQLVIPYSTDDFSMKKLEYIHKRTGLYFNPSDAAKFKIVLNLLEFLNVNGIFNYTRSANLMEPLSKFFIGFLSADNSYVIMRRLVPEGKLPEFIDHRYLIYNIGDTKTGLKFYTIPTLINPLLPVDIHIAEGAFDILSISQNVAPIGYNSIYGAVCGKSYSSIIQYLIIDCGLTGFNLHIYADNDVPNNKVLYGLDYLKLYGCKVFLHRNAFEREKDYGVPRDRIIDSIQEI